MVEAITTLQVTGIGGHQAGKRGCDLSEPADGLELFHDDMLLLAGRLLDFQISFAQSRRLA